MPGPHNNAPGEPIARQVRARGVDDPRVLDALRRVPRERFIPPSERSHAHDDRAVPIGLDQTISQPYMVAVMTRELDLSGGEKVLEIGTGSGYQTAVLSLLSREVYTIERLATLSLRARGLLDGLGLTNIRYWIGDGTLGWPDAAPFDRVLVTAGAPSLPPPLFDQLAEGGVIVAPIGHQEQQQLHVIRKSRGEADARSLFPCRFVKLIGEEGWSGP